AAWRFGLGTSAGFRDWAMVAWDPPGLGRGGMCGQLHAKAPGDPGAWPDRATATRSSCSAWSSRRLLRLRFSGLAGTCLQRRSRSRARAAWIARRSLDAGGPARALSAAAWD